jgi:hypothetical protein
MNTRGVSPGTDVRHELDRGVARAASMCGFSLADDDRLAPFQRFGACWIVETIRRYGGALLCDEVGLGKTRTALVAARIFGGPIEVVAPAHLCAMWRDAMREYGVDGVVVSDGVLSLGEAPECRARLVLVDEAHRFGNLATRRSMALSKRVWGRAVVLISATPARNRTSELAALLLLFLSEATSLRLSGVGLAELPAACDVDLASLLSFVSLGRSVAGALAFDRCMGASTGGFGSLPALPLRVGESVGGIVWSEALISRLDVVARALVPLRGEPGALYGLGVLRALVSSPQAAAATLLRGCAFARRWREARSVGGTLSRAEFRQLFDGSQEQLVFEFWYEAGEVVGGFSESVIAEAEALALELRTLAPVSSETRRWIESVDGGVVLFAERRETVEAVARLFAVDRAVICVTGDRAWIRGVGRVSVAQALDDFRRRCRVGGRPLLVCSAVVSEGVDLQVCGAMMHLDAAWNPARMVQREGRVVRPGGWERVRIARVVPCDALELRARAFATIREKAEALAGLSTGSRGYGFDGLLRMAWAAGSQRRRFSRNFCVYTTRAAVGGVLVVFRGGSWRWLGDRVEAVALAGLVSRGAVIRRRSGFGMRLCLLRRLLRVRSPMVGGDAEREALGQVRAHAVRLARGGRGAEGGAVLARAAERLQCPLVRGGALLRTAHCGAVPPGVRSSAAAMLRWVDGIPVERRVPLPRPVAIWIVNRLAQEQSHVFHVKQF